MHDTDTPITRRITDAIARMFVERGDACLREFTLRTGRRVDIIAIGPGGEITIVEVKSSRQDFLSATGNGRNIRNGPTDSTLPSPMIFRAIFCPMKINVGSSSPTGSIAWRCDRHHWHGWRHSGGTT
jgi:hypothetical protein